MGGKTGAIGPGDLRAMVVLVLVVVALMENGGWRKQRSDVSKGERTRTRSLEELWYKN